MRRLLSKYGSRWAIGLLFTIVACLQGKGEFHTPFIERLDVFFYDMRLLSSEPKLDPRIVIVDIDERSLTEIGRFPWSRDIVAKLVTTLTDTYQVRALGFDVLFGEPDTSSGYARLEALSRKEMADVPSFKSRIESLKPIMDYDGRLAASLQGKPVVLGYVLYDQEPQGMLPAPAFPVSALKGLMLDPYNWKSYRGNISRLQSAARGAGFFNAVLDADGIIRSTPILAKIGGNYYESLGVATARIALGATSVQPVFIDDSTLSKEALQNYVALDSIEFNTLPRPTRIPVDRELGTLVNYHGTGGPQGGGYRYVSAADVLNGKVDIEILKQRIVLVGTTAVGLNDIRSTPVNKEYPGVEVHANVIASILDGSFLQRPDWSVGLDMVQMLLAGALLSFLLPAAKPSLSILLAIGVTSAVVGLNFWLYRSEFLILPLAMSLILIFTLFLFNLGWGYLFEYRKSRAMVNLFGEYVAPELVAEMAENPEGYNMDGESRELTVMFADVRNFTSISEGLAPGPLREYINLYLTAMSEDIRGNRGTLDKYIGDAVMAFWGAPVPLENHAALAVATALKMLESAEKLNQDFISRGLPELKIGIGLNTGEMRVGDMGSKVRRAYTVMGDAVNLSSRLEGITKNYGVGLVVGDATRKAAPDFVYRELDRVRVKGKNEPIPIFQPLGTDRELGVEKVELLAQWHSALADIRAQKWESAERMLLLLKQQEPLDKLYPLYIERIAHYRENPPGDNWDGVWVYNSK